MPSLNHGGSECQWFLIEKHLEQSKDRFQMNFQISSSLQNVWKSWNLLLNSSDSYVSKVKYMVHCLYRPWWQSCKGHNLFRSICFRRGSSFRMNAEMHSILFWTGSSLYLKLNIQVCQVFSDVHQKSQITQSSSSRNVTSFLLSDMKFLILFHFCEIIKIRTVLLLYWASELGWNTHLHTLLRFLWEGLWTACDLVHGTLWN